MNVDELLSGARDAISVRRVFGEPIEQNGTVVVPVAKVGGGGGGGGDNEQNGGGGFGLGARPVGVYVIKDGQVNWRPAIDPVRIAFLAVVALGLLLRAARR
jgi:uncharacterized spore protein YtfJ